MKFRIWAEICFQPLTRNSFCMQVPLSIGFTVINNYQRRNEQQSNNRALTYSYSNFYLKYSNINLTVQKYLTV